MKPGVRKTLHKALDKLLDKYGDQLEGVVELILNNPHCDSDAEVTEIIKGVAVLGETHTGYVFEELIDKSKKIEPRGKE